MIRRSFQRTLLPALPFLLFFFAPRTGSAQSCQNCTPVSIASVPTPAIIKDVANTAVTPATTGQGNYFMTLFSTPSTPLPANLPAGTYPAWCGTTNGQTTVSGTATYTATSTPPSSISPSRLGQQLYWNEINYILNHKNFTYNGTQATIADVQTAIWAIVGVTPSSILNAQPVGVQLANAAKANGQTFVPGPGQTMMVLLITPTVATQHMIIEVTNCAQLGDRVWLDANNDGLQNNTAPVNLGNDLTKVDWTQYFNVYFDGTNYWGSTYSEQGINGVTVQLYDSTNTTLLATTTTGPSPYSYPYMPAQTPGWYQFAGLCPGTYYVRIPNYTGTNVQTALDGLIASPIHVGSGSNVGSDSGNPAGEMATIPSSSAASPVVEILDFGFTGAPALTVTCATPNTGQVNVFYSASVTAAGGVPPYKYTITSGSLPAGLSLDASSGLISGNPTTAGTFNFTVQVADSTNTQAGTVSSSCGITIANSPLSLSCPVGSAQVGTYYNSSLVAGGGVPPYTYSTTSLPAGLSLNASTGVITGYPTSTGSTTFSATVTDSSGGSANTHSSNCNVNVIASGLSLSCASQNATVGVAYNSRLTANGGSGNYTFAIVSGSLPPGLTLNPATGAITGTPDASASGVTYTFTAQVTDGTLNAITTATCSITVRPAIMVTCATGTGYAGIPYSSSIQVVGGSGSFTFSLAAGSVLPAGLSLNPNTGVISGTPTSTGTFTFTVQVLDAVTGATATASCTIQIYTPPTLVCNVPLGFTNASYSGALVATGGTGHYTYSVAAGSSLPSWMSLSATTGALTGTPTQTGAFSFVGQVTDGTGSGSTNVTTTCSNQIVAPVTANCVSITAVQGQAITPVKMTANGGLGGYTFSATGLPAGLGMAADGTISGTPTVSGTFSYTVTITDSAGNKGTTNCSVTVLTPVTANCVTINAVQGIAITPVTMTASGGAGAPYAFTATGLPAGLTMSTSGTISGTPTVSGTMSYTVTIKDSAGNTGTVNCSVTVMPPVSATCAAITAIQGTPITPVTVTATGGTGTGYNFTATGLPAGLTMSTSGTISGTPTASGIFSYSVTITDSAGNTGTINCSVTVLPPVAATCVTITAIEGVTIAPVTMTATGGTGTGYTFSAAGLPAGLTMSGSGTISGTPTVSGTFSYTVTITDSAGNKGTSNCSVTIAPPVTANCVTITAIQGIAIVPVTMAASGGSGTGYTFSATGLPAGLTMSASGTISGTPTVSGTFSYTVTTTDSAANKGTSNCSVTIQPPVSATCVIINAVQGTPITAVTMAASGGVGAPYTFSATGLPSGLTMSSNGTISGTPTVSGTFSYTVTITDAAGNTGTLNCSVTVLPQPSATCAVINAVQGVAITPMTLAAAGGVGGPYTFVATGLPSGLTMSGTGTISGTPLVSGTFNYTVTVADAAGNKGTTNCSVTVIASVSATCVAITAIQGVPITPVTMTATGGTGGYTFSATGLPGGLTMSANGTISGTPTVSGTFNYTVTITDSTGNKGTTNCSVTVLAPLTLACAGGTGTVGAAYSSALTASGGLKPYTFAITAGSLPPGLTLDAATGIISGTPTTSGTFNFTARVTDASGIAGYNTATTNCTINVAVPYIPPPLNLACASGTGQVGAPYSSSLNATGGVAPYTFSITSGALPAGLTLNPATGAITGTPTTAGTFSFTAQVVDSSGMTGSNTATTNCTITIAVNSNICGLTWGYWKNHVDLWPAGSVPMTLGSYSYSAAQLQSILGTPVSGDASLDLAHQLIAAKFNVFNGTNIATANGAISAADNLLAAYTGPLPYGVSSSSTAGAQMTSVASQLNTFNSDGQGQPGCSNSPSPLTLACAASTGTVGVPYSSAVVAGGGLSPYTYAITSGSLPTGLSLNPMTGAITGAPTTPGTFNFSVTATDSSNTGGTLGTVTSNCSITISSPMTLACPTTSAMAGTPYSSTPVVSGGTAPYTFAVASGALPASLTLNASTGLISGTPTAGGTYSFTLRVTDSKGLTATSASCGISVSTPPALSITCPTATGTVGAPYSSAAVVTGGVPPYTFSLIGTLPAGLVLNPSTGAITGTPTTNGSYGFSIKVTDSLGTTAVSSCSGSCGTASSTTFDFSSPLGTLGTSQTYVAGGLTITAYGYANGGTPVKLHGKNDGGDEHGIGIDGEVDNEIDTTHYITLDVSQLIAAGATNPQMMIGSVQAGEGYNVYGSNTLGALGTKLIPAATTDNTWFAIPGYPAYKYISVQASSVDVTLEAVAFVIGGCNITISPAPITVACASSSAMAGTAYSSAVTAAGGVAPYTFTIASGALPAGLSLNASTGAITGTPTAAGTYSFAVKVTDSTGASTTSSNCGISVAPPPVTVACPASSAQAGVAYSSAVMASGGTAPYTFSIASGALPAGLTLNASTGAITGTPTTAGTYSVTFKVTDSRSNTATTSGCSITVSATPLTLSCPSATGTVGTAYSSSAIASGGTAPYTFAVASGSLPPGLTLNTSTGAITGTPTMGGTFAFSIKVTDARGTAALSSCSSSCGGTVTWNFASPVGNLGTSQPYTMNNLTITAYGYSGSGSTGSATSLYGRDDGGTEYGLGIAGTTDNEIDTSHFVTLDFSAVIAAGASNGMIEVGSIQAGEGYNLYGSNTLGSIGTLLSSGGSSKDGVPFAIPSFGTYKYVSVRASTANVLIGAVSFTLGGCNITVSSGAIVSGDAATIGFWHNKNGQALILALNGGSSSTALGNWLANQFPYLYGPSSSNDLTNKSNTTVAALFMTLFGNDKTGAQIMGGALASYVTSSTLAGSTATRYGFNNSVQGTGGKVYNVGGNGSTIGLANNTSYTVLQLLQQVNLEKANGSYSNDATAFNVIFSGINQTGDIQ